ncbi:MAG: sigma-70 family RNA polymerase sigma factor [Gammaproteobacteria bacterium]|jgi:RNA polymerase sigma-70 factor (ECF subfamily)|nr:hypothetical protein [Gammaproteobacteria bacterium]MDP6097547.1 sigma-70 family RNA polymerase sigma factor [Gammaproteobacteria bacterium]HJO12068.1 sigma-70 family RNA polymerase sigma factor [Gammaproteobacteria bacterium]|tara:strand:+ start:316 stop:885 length:570 start_codon:yes stop_codon:yes gene_type:complete
MTDEELMLAICNGDESAFHTIVRTHHKPLSHYAFRILGSKKDTEDITQETFLRLWINADKWQPGKSKLSTWLHRIAHNLCIDYLRKKDNAETEELDDHAVAGAENNTKLEQSSELERLNKALGGLPDNQKNALVLCHYQGFSNKEAAAIMGVSVKAVESSIARAKRSLRKQLASSITDNNKNPKTRAEL